MNKLLFLLFVISFNSFAQSFVKVKGTNFHINNKIYRYMGTNFWYGMNLGMKRRGDRKRLIRELDHLSSLGVKNLRVMAASEGPNTSPYRMTPVMQISPGVYDLEVVEGLDFLLSEMGKREMKAVMVLNNYWVWSGGMAQYLKWTGELDEIPFHPPHPGGDWAKYQFEVTKFYKSNKAQELYQNHLSYIINRKNSLNGKIYKNDPTIMSWELANEPRGDHDPEAYRAWIKKSSDYIRDQDKNHLITVGSEGNTPYKSAGTDLVLDHSFKNIDYATIHIWVQNWNYYNPFIPFSLFYAKEFTTKYINLHLKLAAKLGKPLVLEEFGISRDYDDHYPNTPVSIRDSFYSYVFKEVIDSFKKSNSIEGVNFWAWGGEGRPSNPGGLWTHGDEFIGDPAHETQGWYSVYDNDSSTLLIIKNYSDKF